MTERVDTAWLRSIARNAWDDSVSIWTARLSNAVFIAAAELETLRAVTAWRDISTAPRDGTRVIIGGRGWAKQGEFWRHYQFWSTEKVPTHWQPLPTPPEFSA